MQRAEGPSSRLAPEPTPTRPSLSPPVAFLLLAVVIGIIGAIFYLTRPDAPATPTNPNAAQELDFSLTNEEAITRFEELDRLRHQAFAEVDVSLLPLIYSNDSEVLDIATNELDQLQSDKVRDESIFRTQSIQVIHNTEDEITLKQIVNVTPRFVASKGRDVTTGPELIRRTIIWTLVLRDESWLIHDSVIDQARVLRA